MKKVSVITVTLNSEKTILRCLKSVAMQEGVEIEHIIQDAQSADATIKIARSFSDKLKVYIENDNGCYDGMNLALSKATGDFLIFLNSDDFFSNKHSLLQLTSGFTSPNIALVAGSVLIIDSTGSVVRNYQAKPGIYKRTSTLQLPHPGCVYRTRNLEEKQIKFDSSFRIAADLKLQIELIDLGGYEARVIPDMVTYMATGGASSENLRARVNGWRESARVYRELNFKPSWVYVLTKVILKVKQYNFGNRKKGRVIND